METIQRSSLLDQLQLRKDKLIRTIRSVPEPSKLVNLLQQVDAALEKAEHGAYGICEICNDPIEEERLLADPLVTVCLGCLSEHQQKALENDLEFAAKIQRNLLPKKNLKIDGWEFSYHYNPVGVVSGDFVDLIPLNDDSLIFVIGDVAGKGISASLMMTHLHGLIHSLVSFGMQVNEIVSKVNRLFCESTLYTNYATLIMGKANTNGTIDICVAGHNPPLVLKSGELINVPATGLPVGLFCESEYEMKTIALQKNDSILLYTDGLTESMADGIEYGEERVKSLLMQTNGTAPKEFIDQLLSDHKAWLRQSLPADDLSIMMIKKN